MKTKKLAVNALLAAMCAVLGALSINLGNMKFTFEGLPVLISALLFGLIFAVGWTPCVGAFLGSALMLASQQGSALQGILLFCVILPALASLFWPVPCSSNP